MMDIFRFREFSIRHDGIGQKVTPDSVLLGAWVRESGVKKILDIGTGSGLLALMMAQEYEDADIDAIEIDATHCKIASENFRNSIFGRRIQLLEEDFTEVIPSTVYDLIVCNPPYFTDTLPLHNTRQVARSQYFLPHEVLLQKVADLLREQGKFYVVLPHSMRQKLMVIAITSGLILGRECQVTHDLSDKMPSLCLLAFTKGIQGEIERESLHINEEGKWSKEFIRLTERYYCKT